MKKKTTFNFKSLIKHVTLPKILTGITICLFVYIIRTHVLPMDILVIQYSVLGSYILEMYIGIYF